MKVQVLSPVAGRATLDVLDMQGRSVQRRSELLTEGVNELMFRLGKFPTGVYLLKAVDAQG